jgi:formate dehydrogenase iron-sulfur subunit
VTSPFQLESAALNRDGGPAPGTDGVRFGFFTDTSVCIGCKACEVACKEWNAVPAQPGGGFTGHSLDNTGDLGANAWRHVAFVEQATGAEPTPIAEQVGLEWFGDEPQPPVDVATTGSPQRSEGLVPDFRWLMASDVCKHCREAACLEVCPTGALFYTEFGTVVVQDDVCNGCGYCVTACPFGVIGRRESGLPRGGGAHKCTLCYDRLRSGQQPACAAACPTDSIQFGPLEELRERARGRLDELVEAGVPGAQLYGDDPGDGVGGFGAFFLLLDDPEVYGLPPDPVTPTRRLWRMWGAAAVAGGALAAGVAAAFAGGAR